MAEKFFVIFNQTELPHRELQGENKKHGNEGEVLAAPVECSFVEMEAKNKAEARQVVFDKFGGDVTTLPVTVKNANWEKT